MYWSLHINVPNIRKEKTIEVEVKFEDFKKKYTSSIINLSLKTQKLQNFKIELILWIKNVQIPKI